MVQLPPQAWNAGCAFLSSLICFHTLSRRFFCESVGQHFFRVARMG